MAEVNSSAQTQLDLIKQNTNPSKATTADQKLSDDFDNFLLLLTTQLQNQDPTEPLDTNQFTSQLIQFTVAEQTVATNKNLETLIEYQKSEQLNSAVQYIGRSVDAKGNAGELADGFGSFIYELDAPANSVSVVITDGAGRAVFSGQGPTATGKNRVIWDGINSFNGATEAEGTYFINVVAKDAKGETMTSRTFTTGVVSSAQMKDGEMVLSVAGTDIKLSDVSAVRQATQFVTDEPDETDTGTDDEAAEEDSDDTVDES